MPVIDGVKVACIPCIRGHRSTKCTHQAERIMIPVRKPGRPLSSCPHQKGKPCSCNNITAAIPRHGKCGCGTAEPPAINTEATVKPEPSTPDVTPMSPTRAASFRVQKHKSTKSHSRKQSYDVSLLGQMDPNTINVIPSHNPAPSANGNMNHTSLMSSPVFMPNFQPSFNLEGSLGSHSEYEHTLGRLNGAALNSFFDHPHSAVPRPSPAGFAGNGSTSHSNLSASNTAHPASKPRSPGAGTCMKSLSTGSMSCCAKGPADVSPADTRLEGQKSPAQNALDLMGYGNSISAHGHDIPPLGFANTINDRAAIRYTPQNTTYPYPVSYGTSFYTPLQFAQWQQMMAGQSQGIPTQNGYMNSHSGMGTTVAVPDSYAPADQCGCGEGCQCLGCATHPFNPAMQEYVLSALQEEQSVSPSLSNGDSNGVSGAANETSPGVLPSPVAGASPVSEAASAGINDYLFVSYCPGSPQLCPCGDECACVGCMIHGQPAPRTPVTPEHR